MRGWSVLMLAACSGSSGASTPNDCSAPSGLYDYVFSGGQTNDRVECPIPHDFQQVLPSSDPAPYGCSISASSGPRVSCSQSVELHCPVRTPDGYSGTLTSIATVDSNADSSVVNGHVHNTLSYAGGQGACGATWDFTATRVHQ